MASFTNCEGNALLPLRSFLTASAKERAKTPSYETLESEYMSSSTPTKQLVRSKYFSQSWLDDDGDIDSEEDEFNHATTSSTFSTETPPLACPPYVNPGSAPTDPPVNPYAPARWKQWGTTVPERLAQDRFIFATMSTNSSLIQRRLATH